MTVGGSPSACPTCGSPVHVHTADEGTSSYVPLSAGLVSAAREALNRCLGTSRPGSKGPDSVDVSFAGEDWDAIRDFALAAVEAEGD